MWSSSRSSKEWTWKTTDSCNRDSVCCSNVWLLPQHTAGRREVAWRVRRAICLEEHTAWTIGGKSFGDVPRVKWIRERTDRRCSGAAKSVGGSGMAVSLARSCDRKLTTIRIQMKESVCRTWFLYDYEP